MMVISLETIVARCRFLNPGKNCTRAISRIYTDAVDAEGNFYTTRFGRVRMVMVLHRGEHIGFALVGYERTENPD